ncbi:hypothetical protein ABZ960_02040 [Streptomyces pseudovenezuelae]|uniref:hypothetical protein n=1 Tax=Streptomyces pseudovenezuelae TaxID=67350 RepID=UPI0034A0E051
MNSLLRGCATLLLLIASAGCSAHRPAAAPTAASSPVPSSALLNRALLAPHDLGPSWTVQPKVLSLGYAVRGCAAATEATGPRLRPGASYAETNVQAGPVGPFVDEALIVGPRTGARAEAVRLGGKLAACRHLTLGADDRVVELDLTPVHFTDGMVAARLDGNRSSLPVTGYVTYGPVDDRTAIAFLYLRFGDASSETAYRLYRLAFNKARTSPRKD